MSTYEIRVDGTDVTIIDVISENAKFLEGRLALKKDGTISGRSKPWLAEYFRNLGLMPAIESALTQWREQGRPKGFSITVKHEDPHEHVLDDRQVLDITDSEDYILTVEVKCKECNVTGTITVDASDVKWQEVTV